MTKFKDIVQDCINGCTAHNADENHMHFNINYYVNKYGEYGKGEKYYFFVYDINELEEALYNIVRNNINKNTDVVIADITIKHHGEIIRVNKNNYPYSLLYMMERLL